MIIVPEIETVVILVPRTGTRSLRKALLARYPNAMAPYRHMEADGVPRGYDRWRRVGVVRPPVERLWSLYKFLRGVQQHADWAPGFADRMRASAAAPFEQWLVENQTVFTHPYWGEGGLGFWPKYTVCHSLPETRKSQFLYLRPDLGTRIWHFGNLRRMAEDLGVSLGRENETEESAPPALNAAAVAHIRRWFAWDLENAGGHEDLAGALATQEAARG